MPAYKFRVLIDTETGGDIFRDILISSSENLETFYRTIVNAFDFKGDQMASFYKSNNEWDKGQEVTLLDMGMGDSDEPALLMESTPISELITEADQKLILVYDFMRMWCFLIELVETQSKSLNSPQVLLAVGTAPKEDSKAFENSEDLVFGETLDLGDDFDDIFNEDDEDFMDDDDLDMGGFGEESSENDFY